MYIHEYQAKQLYAQMGVPVPPGNVASTLAEARATAEKLFAAGRFRLAGGDVFLMDGVLCRKARDRDNIAFYQQALSGFDQSSSQYKYMQSWIIEEAKHAGIGPVDIRLNINPGGGNTLKLRQLSAQIHARFEPAALLKLMHAIAAHDRLLVVERLELQATATPYFEMLLETYLRPARGA